MKTRTVFIAALLLTLNLVLGKLAATVSLPVYLDSVGTIIAAALVPLPYAIGVGVCTSLAGGLVINPYFPPYAPVQFVIALVAVLLCRAGFLRRWWSALLAGFLIGLAAMITAAPITTVIFGGVTLTGTTAINAVLIASGHSILKSVLGGSFLIESVDKPAAALLAHLVLKRLPAFLKERPSVSTPEGPQTKA
jgi:energy-coupling factor transport system substrate-specific component